ncbi:MAG TPA: peptidylprolyl isomerase [Candidatus Avibacteroides avistercoris]|uniref:Peptidylprolyl isomerase n=1 Tax=Candidatus Avibacteroides avistercoris TaxID=2840690 RepID=A0A9D2UIF7_9BACT|nr:peptidylprolyl isomerase [Candidatus Avibacteroides avistercoris]
MIRTITLPKPILLLISVIISAATYAQDNIIDQVVWVVGDEAILKSEVEEERLNALMEHRDLDGDPYCVIPEQLAIQKLFLNQAEIDSIEVTESEVIARLDAQLNFMIQQIGSEEKVEEYFNKTMTQIREKLRQNIHDGLTAQRMQQEIVGEIKVTPAEVRNFFNQLPYDSIPYIPTNVEVQIITREPKVPQKEVDAVKAQLREFTDRINSGETSFSTLALLYSEDPGSRMRGGELGFMGRGQLLPEFANVAFNLQDPNKVSKIVETEYGFHIIQLIEKRGDRINCRHILLRPHIPSEAIDSAMLTLDSIADNIRNAKYTFEQAALYLSDDKDTRLNNGLMPNPYDNTSKFEMQQLPQEIARVVDALKVGEISDPFTMVTDNGMEVCAIVKLKTKTEGHKATISEDYQRLKDLVTQQMGEEKLKEWIKEKLKTTYVRIDPAWRNCDFKYEGWIKE